MRPKFYMLVGLPGSGKSTIATELGGEIFSSDKLREELYGNENVQEHNSELFKELHARIKKALKDGKDCIYDATNIKSKRREQFLTEIKSIDCDKICIMVASDINVCLARNKLRDRIVPYEVIKRMYFSIDIPQYREGWDKIIIKRALDNNNEYDIFKFIDYLSTINHDNPHHLLTIGGHIQAATKYIIDNYKLTFAGDIHRLERLITAAMYHDIGKKITKTFVNSKGETTDIAHYYNHENVSAYMYLLYETEENINNNLDKVLYVADLIGLHMKMHCIGADKSKVYEKIKKEVGQVEFEDLCILNEADTICS